MAAAISFCSSIIILCVIFPSCLCSKATVDNAVIGTEREALEIIIGGGGDSAPAPSPDDEYCPPPPPPEPLCPPPPHPPPPPPPPSHPPPPPPPSSHPPPPPPPPSHPTPRHPPSRPPPSPAPFPSENLKRDYYVIREFKKKITYDPKGITKSWRGNNICKYTGFTCAMLPDQKVLALAILDFHGYGFGGQDLQLSGLVDKLPDLSLFHSNSNNFTGPLPTRIGAKDIRYLFEFDLSNNKYGGGFPMSVLAATNLTFLEIRFNHYSGPVPAEAFKLDLDLLFLNNNQFSQQLPDNLGSTAALYLNFANNKFTGPIPSSIGKARNLLEVLFLNNQFSGCLPCEIGFLKRTRLFDVGNNKLTGPIPQSFACLEKMEALNLAQNQFYGPVPELICKLPSLSNLTLSYNYFTQVGPECKKLISKKILNVRMNCISDLPDQRSAADCAAFFSSRYMKCPNEKSFSYIPCKKNAYLSSSYKAETDDQQKPVAAAPPRSYDALLPHKLRF